MLAHTRSLHSGWMTPPRKQQNTSHRQIPSVLSNSTRAERIVVPVLSFPNVLLPSIGDHSFYLAWTKPHKSTWIPVLRPIYTTVDQTYRLVLSVMCSPSNFQFIVIRWDPSCNLGQIDTRIRTANINSLNHPTSSSWPIENGRWQLRGS